jgi:hypothetical protein
MKLMLGDCAFHVGFLLADCAMRSTLALRLGYLNR